MEPHTRLLERESLLTEMGSLLEDAGSGTGSMLLVGGEAGIGKTSLARRFVAAVDRIDVLWGGCDPFDTPRVLGPVHDIMVSSSWGPFDRPAGEDPIETFDVFLQRLRDAPRPVVVVIEDIHWADSSTTDLLRFLGRRIGNVRALLLATFRDDELDATHPTTLLLGDLASRPRVLRRSLEPLSVGAVAELANESELDAVDLHAVTGGNPFFVTEIIASGDRLPGTVRDAVLSRVARLLPDARAAAETVSVSPRPLEIDVVIEVSRVGPDAVDAAVMAGVLVSHDNRLAFRHELARSAVGSSLPPGRRIELHRSMVGALRTRPGEEMTTRVIHHAIEAGDVELAAQLGRPAARAAREHGSYREAASLLELVLKHLRTLGPRDRIEMQLELGSMYGALGRHDERRTMLRSAVRNATELEEIELLARVLLDLGRSEWTLGDRPEARRCADRAVQLLRAVDAPGALAFALGRSGALHMVARMYEPARVALDEAIDLVREADDPELMSALEMDRSAIDVVMGDSDAALEVMHAAIEARRKLDDDIRLADELIGRLGSGAGEARRYELARSALEEGIRLAVNRDADALADYARAWLARIDFEQGRWSSASRWAADVIEAPRPNRHSLVTALGALGRVRVRRGDPGAVDVLERAIELGSDGELQHRWSPVCGLAELLVTAGRIGAARALLEPHYAEALDTDSPWARGELGYWMHRAGGIESAPPHAADPFAALIEADWQAAARLWDELGCPFEKATALSVGGESAQLEAVEIFDDLGARPAADAARKRLRDAGATGLPSRPRSSSVGNPAGLTKRQLEVTECIVAGLGNSEISERLFISPKTVEHHVTAVFMKLGVDTRPKAIAAALALGIGPDGGGHAKT